jgi:hypothetical protein
MRDQAALSISALVQQVCILQRDTVAKQIEAANLQAQGCRVIVFSNLQFNNICFTSVTRPQIAGAKQPLLSYHTS